MNIIDNLEEEIAKYPSHYSINPLDDMDFDDDDFEDCLFDIDPNF